MHKLLLGSLAFYGLLAGEVAAVAQGPHFTMRPGYPAYRERYEYHYGTPYAQSRYQYYRNPPHSYFPRTQAYGPDWNRR